VGYVNRDVVAVVKLLLDLAALVNPRGQVLLGVLAVVVLVDPAINHGDGDIRDVVPLVNLLDLLELGDGLGFDRDDLFFRLVTKVAPRNHAFYWVTSLSLSPVNQTILDQVGVEVLGFVFFLFLAFTLIFKDSVVKCLALFRVDKWIVLEMVKPLAPKLLPH
jgi:hypothetical protein